MGSVRSEDPKNLNRQQQTARGPASPLRPLQRACWSDITIGGLAPKRPHASHRVRNFPASLRRRTIACRRQVAFRQHLLEKSMSLQFAIARSCLDPKNQPVARLAVQHGSGGAFGGDGIMNPRRFTTVAPAFCGSLVLAGSSSAGWLASVRPAPRTPAQCQSRTAQPLSPPTPGSQMNRRQSQWPTPLSPTPLTPLPLAPLPLAPLPLAPKWRRPPNP